MMVSAEVRSLLAQLKSLAHKTLASPLVGEYETARKSMGLEFFQLREYQPGDDVRFIDWKSSLRSPSLMVRESIELRTQTIVLLLDVSGSSWYGSNGQRLDVLKKMAAMIGYVTARLHNRLSLIIFGDQIVEHIPAQSGERAIESLLERCMAFNASKGVETDIKSAMRYAFMHYGSQASYIVLSDFFVDQESLLTACHRRFEVAFLQVISPVEQHLPYRGAIAMVDIETNEHVEVVAAQATFKDITGRMVHDFHRLCQQQGVGHLLLYDNEPDLTLAQSLIKFFMLRLSQSI